MTRSRQLRADLPDFGPGVDMTAIAPGRFANAIQRSRHGVHGLQVVREDLTSSFVLDLLPDGMVRVCRGWRYQSFNDGPEVHTAQHVREQLGYRGEWTSRDGWVDLHLERDDGVCPPVGQYSDLVPRHRAEWHGRGLPVAGEAHPWLSRPVLACQFPEVERTFGEGEPHVISGVLPGTWLLLGAGNGLRIHVQGGAAAPGDEAGKEAEVVRLEHTTEPIGPDAWERSFS